MPLPILFLLLASPIVPLFHAVPAIQWTVEESVHQGQEIVDPCPYN